MQTVIPYYSMKYFAIYFLFLFSYCENKQQSNNKKSVSKTENYDCQHCGMPSNDYPQWQARLVLNEQNVWFCSPRCLVMRYHFAEKKAEKVESIWVKDYYTQQFIDAKNAYFVCQSLLLGPMGNDLIPHKDRNSAQDFAKEHSGKEILQLKEIDTEKLKKIIQAK